MPTRSVQPPVETGAWNRVGIYSGGFKLTHYPKFGVLEIELPVLAELARRLLEVENTLKAHGDWIRARDREQEQGPG